MRVWIVEKVYPDGRVEVWEQFQSRSAWMKFMARELTMVIQPRQKLPFRIETRECQESPADLIAPAPEPARLDDLPF